MSEDKEMTMEILVTKGNVEEKTLQIEADQELHITIESGARLKLLLECNGGNVVTDIVVGQGASLDLCDLDMSEAGVTRSHDLHILMDADSQAFIHTVSLANGNARNSTKVELNGEGAELSLNGLVIASQSQRVENHTLVHHAVPHCTSSQLFKYVLDDHAVGTYAGLVKVFEGAHHTHSEQTNRNLCLTREAHMYTQPQLEIYNDDVRCSHGATVGQLDENALFYMQQRGISKHEAQLLLMSAFAGEVVDLIRIPELRERLHSLVERRFRNL